MTNSKMTKVEAFELALVALKALETEEAETAYEIVEGEISRRKNAAKRAADKRAEKKAEGDAATEIIAGLIGEAPITVGEIVALYNEGLVDEPEITPNKVTARTKKLVDAGRIYRTTVKTSSGKKVAYSTIDPDAPEAEDEVEE